ncbi:MAG: hypothetical protein ACAI38_06400 [Myxococcota bacterium]|nr:hypothetical protein [Myxococcota bacterium]
MSSSRNLVVSAVMLGMWLASFALLQGASHFDTGAVAYGSPAPPAAGHASVDALPAVADAHQELSADIEDDAPDDVCVDVADLTFRAPARAGIAHQRGLESVRSQWLVHPARGPPLS